MTVDNIQEVLYKICKSCGIKRDINCFHKHKKSSDGFRSNCKKCRSTIEKQKRFDFKNNFIGPLLISYKNNYKICTKCKYEKHIDNFNNYRKSKDGKYNSCLDCRKEYRDSNKQLIKYQKSKHYFKNIDTYKKYKKDNAESISKYMKKYRNCNKESIKIYQRIYSSKKRAEDLYRVPNWLTEEDFNKIKTFYLECKELTEKTGILYHVDHIIPLKGKKVSGLHVPNNLQILTAEENIRKNNKFDVSEFNDN